MFATLYNSVEKRTEWLESARTGIELFASEGLCYVPMPVNIDPMNTRLVVEAQEGEASVTSLSVHELSSAWNPN